MFNEFDRVNIFTSHIFFKRLHLTLYTDLFSILIHNYKKKIEAPSYSHEKSMEFYKDLNPKKKKPP